MGKQPLNQILFGPPGTGKTYNTIYKALSILEPEIDYKEGKTREDAKAKFDEYVASGRIVFTTFHQSMSYEDFIEGIKPKLNSTNISYKIENGIFKNISESSLNKYYVPAYLLKFCYNDIVLDVKKNNIKTLSQKNGSKVTIIEKNNSLYFQKNGQPAKIAFEKVIEVINYYGSDFSKVAPADIHKKFNDDGSAIWAIANEVLRRAEEHEFEKKSEPTDNKPFVLIIDEINRGNVANIFGELITLIEDDKRTTKWDDNEGKYVDNPEGIKVKLPYSGDEFGVPGNLYIIGTMNTADRSVEALDSALRRRFTFEEMMPDTSKISKDVEKVNLQDLLATINKRIEVLKDREHQIGHSYFIGVKSKQDIIDVIQKKVVPLLQEYFYGDYEKIMKVIGEGFVTKDKPNVSFASGGDNPDIPDAIYRIVREIKDDSIDKALENINFGFNKPEVTQSNG